MDSIGVYFYFVFCLLSKEVWNYCLFYIYLGSILKKKFLYFLVIRKQRFCDVKLSVLRMGCCFFSSFYIL